MRKVRDRIDVQEPLFEGTKANSPALLILFSVMAENQLNVDETLIYASHNFLS